MTQFTNPVVIPANAWINLGSGQLSVAANGPEWPLVSLIVADVEPSLPPPQGEPLRDRRFFNTVSNVWAVAHARPATVIVTAPDAGTGGSVTSKDAQLVPCGYFSVSVGASAQTLSALIGASLPSGARLVYIEPESGDIRFRDDGTAPTASTGIRVYSGVAWPYNGNLSSIELIAVSAVTVATVNLAFYQ